jgi:tetratricopeptide (TPR) repeat protein
MLVALLRGAAVRADEDPVAAARAHFEAARRLYNIGKYKDSIAEFEACYLLAPRPPLLLDLGQAYRQLGELRRARDLYVRYLREASLDDPDRGSAQKLVADLDREIAAQPAAPPPTTAGAQPVTGADVPPLPPVSAAAATTASAPSTQPTVARSHRLRHLAWALPLGAVVLAGATVGLVFAFKPASEVNCASAEFGCLDTRR